MSIHYPIGPGADQVPLNAMLGDLARMSAEELRAIVTTLVGSAAMQNLSSPGDRWGVVPFVDAAGVTEIGNRLDMHASDAGSSDYAMRLYATTTGLYRYIDGIDDVARVLFDQKNAVGTVAQSGGVATGAIIERGSNANGEYTRWADGTQECWKRIAMPGATTAVGSIYRGPSVNVGSLPAAFIDTPCIVPGGTSGAGGGWIAQDVFQSATTWGTWSTRHAASDPNQGALCLHAIGRWY